VVQYLLLHLLILAYCLGTASHIGIGTVRGERAGINITASPVGCTMGEGPLDGRAGAPSRAKRAEKKKKKEKGNENKKTKKLKTKEKEKNI
jgi:hypothetical protein